MKAYTTADDRYSQILSRPARAGEENVVATAHARRQRTPPHHGHRRARAGEPGFLRRRARDAARQAQRQPGRSGHLPPLLRGRGRASRLGSHVLSVGRDGAGPARATAWRWKSGSRCRRAASATGASGSQRYGTRPGPAETRFGEQVLPFADPHGLRVALVERKAGRPFTPWDGSPVPAERQIRGLHGAQLWERDASATARFLTAVLGFQQLASEKGLDAVRLSPTPPASSTCETRPTRAAAAGASAACTISPGAWTTRRIRPTCGRGSRRRAPSRRR